MKDESALRRTLPSNNNDENIFHLVGFVMRTAASVLLEWFINEKRRREKKQAAFAISAEKCDETLVKYPMKAPHHTTPALNLVYKSRRDER